MVPMTQTNPGEDAPITICLVDAPPEGSEPGAILEALHRASAMTEEVWFDRLGHKDFTELPEANLNGLLHQQYARKREVIALEGEVTGLVEGPEGLPYVVPTTDLGDARVVASCYVMNSREDNPHLLSEVEIAVAAGRRHQGIGTRMLAALEQLARAWGATTISGWANYLGIAEGEKVMPTDGPFGVPVEDEVTRFMQKHGFALAQTERHSIQPMDGDLGVFGEPAAPEGYTLEVWCGRMDPTLAEDVARLDTVFEATMPHGELDFQPETYTAERVLAGNEVTHKDSDTVNVAARHLATGEMVARTTLAKYLHKDEAAWQGVTVVLPAHRGHGLGRAIKLAAMHEARRRWPKLERVHTWNAGENDHMWAINESLGYRTAGVCGAWQKKLA